MPMQLYRATVRGHFDTLDDDVRARLRAEAHDHDHLHASFTPDGTLVYDPALVAFSLRYELRIDHEERAEADALAEAAALERAERRLRAEAIRAKHLRVSVTNMASTWERASGGTAGPRRRR